MTITLPILIFPQIKKVNKKSDKTEKPNKNDETETDSAIISLFK